MALIGGNDDGGGGLTEPALKHICWWLQLQTAFKIPNIRYNKEYKEYNNNASGNVDKPVRSSSGTHKRK